MADRAAKGTADMSAIADFLSRPSYGPARLMLMASIKRSQMSDEDLIFQVHDGEKGTFPLWWGPIVEVEPGDRVTVFPTPMGLVLEAVEKKEDYERRMAARQQPQMQWGRGSTTVKFTVGGDG